MNGKRLATLIVPITFGLALAAAPTRAQPPAGNLVRIGMLESMFKDVKPAMFNALSKPFYSLVESQTGLKSELCLVPNPDEMRLQLDSGKLQFGVFHGYEFAWMRLKQPALEPLMIAASQYRPLRAYLVVNSGNAAGGIADLKGKALAMPKGSREHARLFIDRLCQKSQATLTTYFGQVTATKTPEDALHDVVDEEVAAAVVDNAGLDNFATRNPGRFKRLKVLVTSEVFPPSVVAYRPGVVDDDVVRRFRQGMGNANATPLGRQLMSLWMMTGFEPIPHDYLQSLTDIVKAYPPPGEAAPK